MYHVTWEKCLFYKLPLWSIFYKKTKLQVNGIKSSHTGGKNPLNLRHSNVAACNFCRKINSFFSKILFYSAVWALSQDIFSFFCYNFSMRYSTGKLNTLEKMFLKGFSMVIYFTVCLQNKIKRKIFYWQFIALMYY